MQARQIMTTVLLSEQTVADGFLLPHLVAVWQIILKTISISRSRSMWPRPTCPPRRRNARRVGAASDKLKALLTDAGGMAPEISVRRLALKKPCAQAVRSRPRQPQTLHRATTRADLC